MKRVTIFVLAVLLAAGVRCFGQDQNIMSTIYFPGAVGINMPAGHLRNGFMLTTALEYRPVNGNAFFFRFDYDAINNHYQRVYLNSPSNVNTGTLSSSIFSAGAGYRKRSGKIGLFAILQPGLGINSYDQVSNAGNTLTISRVNRKHFSLKATAGIELYLATHFALTIEPSCFYLQSDGNYQLLNPHSVNLSLGFTTTLF